MSFWKLEYMSYFCHQRYYPVLHSYHNSTISRTLLAGHFAGLAFKTEGLVLTDLYSMDVQNIHEVSFVFGLGGDFSACASECWYVLQQSLHSPGPDAARPIRLHSPDPDLILRHQLFPGSRGSPHASRSEKMCFTLWPCRKHARSLIRLTCAPEWRYVTVWAQRRVLKHIDPILCSCDFSPCELDTAVEQSRFQNYCDVVRIWMKAYGFRTSFELSHILPHDDCYWWVCIFHI